MNEVNARWHALLLRLVDAFQRRGVGLIELIDAERIPDADGGVG